MPVDIDGFVVLGAIARHPHAFSAARADAAKAAKALIGKQVKDKGFGLDGLRALATALDMGTFELVADAMSDAEIRSVLAKVDKHNGAIKIAPSPDQRHHVAALARGDVAAATKSAATKPAKPPAAPKPALERSGNSKAMRARKKV